ncbi:hypothetical protein, partial [Thermonema rossianum]|uniref:hypothetical protein n=1 Tax=Thermonema rossianum TaxID=55505 RepID=UPI000571C629
MKTLNTSISLMLLFLLGSVGLMKAQVLVKLETLGDLKSYKQVQFRNVQTGEYIISWNDPRGGGVLESSQKPDDKGFRFYQAANAAPGNCEIKRIGWDAFNWSAYPKFIAVNHAKRIPNTT